MAAIRRVFARLLSWFRSARAEDDLAREIRAHLQLLEDKFRAEGMGEVAAMFAARRAFGGVEQAKERQRDARSFRWLVGWSVDLKLGFRMLVRYPGLSLVAGLGMTVAIAVGATSFAFFYASLHPTLPLDEGDRIIGLENWDSSRNNQEDRILHHFTTWRGALTSVQDVSASEMVRRNLIAPDGQSEELTVAIMTASGFRVARVPPLIGRALFADDERKGAPPVAVLGHDVWRRRFSSDPRAIGATVHLGSAAYTVVGVMPDGFAFPMNHQLWIPMQADPLDYQRRRGPNITVFGRLAPGATLADAQAELTVLGRRAAAAFPATDARLIPRAVRYTELWFDDEPRADVHVLQVLVTLLVVIVGVNVASLVYARTATRQGEIAVRTALGASRGRIVAQLFAEALVLSSAAATLGLVAAKVILQQANAAARLFGAEIGGVPFWMNFEMSAGTIVYTGALALLAAVIAGVAPALKATGRRAQLPLKQLGGGSGPQLGRTWTTLVVGQVAFAVAVLPTSILVASQSLALATAKPGFAADAFVLARVQLDWDTPASADARSYARAFDARFQDRFGELVRRAEREPGVGAVTIMSREPGNELPTRVEIDGAPESSGYRVGPLRVGGNFFETFEVPIVAGRPFTREDLGRDRVIVSRTFVDLLLGGGNPVGRRIRYVGEDVTGSRTQRWYEIVGVAGDFPARPMSPDGITARLYHPTTPGDEGAMLAVRMRAGDPKAFAPRLRRIATELDPALRLVGVRSLAEAYDREQMGMHAAALGLSVVAGSVLLLAAAGIYALMSVAVTRRRKEIGIRMALGADLHRILRSLFQRALAQVALGVVFGLSTAALLDRMTGGELLGRHGTVILPAVSAFMIVVGLLATLGPARRGLRINPIEALKAE